MSGTARTRASGRTPWLVILLAALALAATGCGGDYVGDRGVRMYCTYGAMSTAERDGCIVHTTVAQVRSRSSYAARYAKSLIDRPRGWAERCVRDDDHSADCGQCAEQAGPLCFDAAKDELDAFCDKAASPTPDDPSLFLGARECDQSYADLSARREAAGFGPQVR